MIPYETALKMSIVLIIPYNATMEKKAILSRSKDFTFLYGSSDSNSEREIMMTATISKINMNVRL